MSSSKSAGTLATAARPTLHALSSAPEPAMPSSTSAPMLAAAKPKARTRSDTFQTSRSLKPAATLRSAASLSRKTGAKLDPSATIAARRPSTAALVPHARSRVVSSSALSTGSDSSAFANVTNSPDLRSSGSSAGKFAA